MGGFEREAQDIASVGVCIRGRGIVGGYQRGIVFWSDQFGGFVVVVVWMVVVDDAGAVRGRGVEAPLARTLSPEPLQARQPNALSPSVDIWR